MPAPLTTLRDVPVLPVVVNRLGMAACVPVVITKGVIRAVAAPGSLADVALRALDTDCAGPKPAIRNAVRA